jgi:hypothetical protein
VLTLWTRQPAAQAADVIASRIDAITLVTFCHALKT